VLFRPVRELARRLLVPDCNNRSRSEGNEPKSRRHRSSSEFSARSTALSPRISALIGPVSLMAWFLLLSLLSVSLVSAAAVLLSRCMTERMLMLDVRLTTEFVNHTIPFENAEGDLAKRFTVRRLRPLSRRQRLSASRRAAAGHVIDPQRTAAERQAAPLSLSYLIPVAGPGPRRGAQRFAAWRRTPPRSPSPRGNREKSARRSRFRPAGRRPRSP
jgi:hypothetical protein